MQKLIMTLLFILILVSIVIAQDGNFVKSQKLPDGWEFYQLSFSNNLIISLPVLTERTNFLEEKLQINSDEEEGKYIQRITYLNKNNLYLFLIATRGVVPSIKEKSGTGLQEIINQQISKVYSIIAADGFAGLKGLKQALSDVTKGMAEDISVPKYFLNEEEFIYFVSQGFHKKALRKGEDNSDEVKANIEIIQKYLTWKTD